MKKYFWLLLGCTLCLFSSYSYAANRVQLYKDFYINMTQSEFIKRSNTEFFAGHTWELTGGFNGDKLSKISLYIGSTKTQDVEYITFDVIKEMQQNKFVNAFYISANKAYTDPSFEIVKNGLRQRSLSFISFDIDEIAKLFPSKKAENMLEIAAKYPQTARVACFTYYNGSFLLEFLQYKDAKAYVQMFVDLAAQRSF